MIDFSKDKFKAIKHKEIGSDFIRWKHVIPSEKFIEVLKEAEYDREYTRKRLEEE